VAVEKVRFELLFCRGSGTVFPVNNKARLTYRYAPACIVSGAMARKCWYTVYDRSGRIVIETADEYLANKAAEQFDEIVEAELEDCA
jgi:hypothetical protein